MKDLAGIEARTSKVHPYFNINGNTRRIYKLLLPKIIWPAEWHYREGIQHFKAKEWQKAINSFRVAISKNGSHAKWHYHLGKSYQKKKSWKDAVYSLSRAISIDSSNGKWHLQLGKCYEKLKMSTNAISSYSTSLQKNPRSMDCRLSLAKCYERKKEWQKAIDVYAESNDIFLLYRRAKCFEKLNLREQADKAYMEMLDADLGEAGVVESPIKKTITGWVPGPFSESDDIKIKVNGTVIARTRPAATVYSQNGRQYAKFRRQINELWQYASKDDRVEIEFRGSLVPSACSKEIMKIHTKSNVSRTVELNEKLEEGFVFNKYGRLRLSIQNNEWWKENIHKLYRDLRDELDRAFSLTLFPIYGTMLGAVREGDYIGHDNDFDTIYISRYCDPDEVKSEFFKVCEYLISRGYKLRVKKTHIWVKAPNGKAKIDIFFSWFNRENLYETSYGYHGNPLSKSKEFFQMKEFYLADKSILIPENSRGILSQLYGDSWQTPDPGFTHHSRTRKRFPQYHLTKKQINHLNWKMLGASSFFVFALEKIENDSFIVEFSCGEGQDSLCFARSGMPVLAGDHSPENIVKAQKNRSELDNVDVNFKIFDAASLESLGSFLDEIEVDHLNESGRSVVIYMRLFLHSIDESSEQNLINFLVNKFVHGFRLFVELRSGKDKSLTNIHDDHSGRLINESDFAHSLENRWGFKIEELMSGPSLSPFKGEYPNLVRLIASFKKSSVL